MDYVSRLDEKYVATGLAVKASALDENHARLCISNDNLQDCINRIETLADGLFGCEPEAVEPVAGLTPARPGRVGVLQDGIDSTEALVRRLTDAIDRLEQL